jgi:cytoskeletal protein CcmA (bactofilin family)
MACDVLMRKVHAPKSLRRNRMWNKREETATPGAPTPNPAPRTITTTAPTGRATAVIGASVDIKGEIRSREELLIEGEVDGMVESASAVIIGPNGKVKANIKAREVAVFGAVRGNVEVSEKIAIREKGSLIGDIKTAGISIDDGAYFKGSIDIVRPEPKVSKVAVLSEPAPAANAGD